jgi:hypothetical protein
MPNVSYLLVIATGVLRVRAHVYDSIARHADLAWAANPSLLYHVTVRPAVVAPSATLTSSATTSIEAPDSLRRKKRVRRGDDRRCDATLMNACSLVQRFALAVAIDCCRRRASTSVRGDLYKEIAARARARSRH